MLDTTQFGNALKTYGFDFYAGVPCSFLKHLINYAINDCDYIASVNEAHAVAACSGAYVGGRKSVVLMQNSGLTNAVSPLTSLNYVFKIPVLGFVSLRGEPGIPDEPQHELTGRTTIDQLELMDIKWEFLSDSIEKATEEIALANAYIEDDRTFFFVVKKGTFEPVTLQPEKERAKHIPSIIDSRASNTFPTRLKALETINGLKDGNTVLIATTGKTGRELYEIEDADSNLYMVGSMGCISSFSMGLALARPDKNIIAIDGDGSLLMHIGSMATIGYYASPNLLHIVLDNNSYDSTGGQSTVSHHVDFIKIAEACGYADICYAHSLEELEKSIESWKQNKKLTFIYLKTAKGSKKDLGRPKIKPFEVKERLIQYIGNAAF